MPVDFLTAEQRQRTGAGTGRSCDRGPAVVGSSSEGCTEKPDGQDRAHPEEAVHPTLGADIGEPGAHGDEQEPDQERVVPRRASLRDPGDGLDDEERYQVGDAKAIGRDGAEGERVDTPEVGVVERRVEVLPSTTTSTNSRRRRRATTSDRSGHRHVGSGDRADHRDNVGAP